MKNYSKEDLLKDLKNLRALPGNILTASRLTAPFIIPSIALSGNIPLLLGASAAFMLTDFADGKIARALGGETKLGEKLDQIADKFCAGGLLLLLVPQIPGMALPLVLEGIIAAINADTLKKGGETKSIPSGRAKMWPLSIMMIAAYGSIATKGQFVNKILEGITKASFAATIVLETENILEYRKINDEITKKNKIRYVEPNDILEYIENCDNIDTLSEIKEVIGDDEVNVTENHKQKTLTN